jgi:DNA-binding transcriptional LysR family regulator
MDYVDSLRIFRSVFESTSFTRAADKLGLTAPVVSRGIASLEQRLGTRLFNRTTRQISMTEAGERFYDRCAKILDDLESLEADTLSKTKEVTGVLRLVAHTTATVNRLVPLIASFKAKSPKISLDVTLIERPVDLAAEGYDLGIVLPYMLTSETTITRLLERIPLVIVATPEYLRKHASPMTPTDLNEHHFVTMSPYIRRPVATFKVGSTDVSVPLKSDISSNNAIFNREMVLAGFGLGVVPEAIVQTELSTGSLVRVLSKFELIDGAIEIRLAYVTRALLPAKVTAFIEHAAAFYEKMPHQNRR